MGLLVARNKYAAFGARSRVKITYEDIKKVIVDIRQTANWKDRKVAYCDESKPVPNLAMPCRGFDRLTAKKVLQNLKEKKALQTLQGASIGDPKSLEDDKFIKVKGEMFMDRQYHFHMETQICICVPKENGMAVYSATQHMNGVQAVIAAALNVPANQ